MLRAAIAAVAILAWSVAASADPVYIKPGEMVASPGQYAGYLDWAAKTKFTANGIPDDVVNDYMHCSTQAYYYMMTPAEQNAVDAAARTNGITREEGDAFQRNLMKRLGAEKIIQNTHTFCLSAYNRFASYVTGKDLCGDAAPTVRDAVSC